MCKGSVVDLATARVIGRHDERVLWPCHIVFGDGVDASLTFGNLGDTPLLLKRLNTSSRRLITREMFYCAKQGRDFLANDPVKMRSSHPCCLHLLEGLSRVHALVLPDVADEQNTVLWANLSRNDCI
jgi:hypothetical protein